MHYRTVIAALLSLPLLGCQLQPQAGFEMACDRRNNLECATTLLAQLDKQVADAYQQTADAEEDESIKRLAKSQRDWLKFRDSYAEFVSMRETDATQVQLSLVNQKIEIDLLRLQALQKLRNRD